MTILRKAGPKELTLMQQSDITNHYKNQEYLKFTEESAGANSTINTEVTINDPGNPAHNNLNAGTSDVSFIKIFIQPSIGMTFNGFDFAFSTRFNRLSFNKTDNQIDKLSNEYEFDKLNTIAQTKNFLFFEPALTIRGGWKYLKVQLQGATASYLNNEHYHFDQYHISIGLNVAIAKRYLKRCVKITKNAYDIRVT